MGIEPTYSAWKAEVLPLNYTRKYLQAENRPQHVRTIPKLFDRKRRLASDLYTFHLSNKEHSSLSVQTLPF